MKVTLVFPPQFDPSLPHLALPCLTAILVRAGHQVVQRDVNLELYDEILTAEGIHRSLDLIHERRESFSGGVALLKPWRLYCRPVLW